MASRFVVCKDKAEARKYFDAGLLYLNMAMFPDAKWEPAVGVDPVERYGKWPWENKNDYAYIVEEDDVT
jgi:hypothetical protein